MRVIAPRAGAPVRPKVVWRVPGESNASWPGIRAEPRRRCRHALQAAGFRSLELPDAELATRAGLDCAYPGRVAACVDGKPEHQGRDGEPAKHASSPPVQIVQPGGG